MSEEIPKVTGKRYQSVTDMLINQHAAEIAHKDAEIERLEQRVADLTEFVLDCADGEINERDEAIKMVRDLKLTRDATKDE